MMLLASCWVVEKQKTENRASYVPDQALLACDSKEFQHFGLKLLTH